MMFDFSKKQVALATKQTTHRHTHTKQTQKQKSESVCLFYHQIWGIYRESPGFNLIHFNVYELTPDSDRGSLSPGFKTTVV